MFKIEKITNNNNTTTTFYRNHCRSVYFVLANNFYSSIAIMMYVRREIGEGLQWPTLGFHTPNNTICIKNTITFYIYAIHLLNTCLRHFPIHISKQSRMIL